MKKLYLKVFKVIDGEPVMGEDDKQLFEMKELFMSNGTDVEIPVQVKDYMDTDTYFQTSMIDDENKALAMKKQGYYLMKELIINPKVDDKVIGALPWDLSMKIIKALRETFMPEDSFLELGVKLDDPFQE